jgi:hypothetical protein
MLITGKCHCGNIAFTLTWSGSQDAIVARSCGCTFCSKHGCAWIADSSSELEVAVSDLSRMSQYTFETHTATFYICSTCGVSAFVCSEIEGQLYAVVNVNSVENLDRSRLVLSPADFESETLESRTERRKRHWIPKVRFRTGSTNSSTTADNSQIR